MFHSRWRWPLRVSSFLICNDYIYKVLLGSQEFSNGYFQAVPLFFFLRYHQKYAKPRPLSPLYCWGLCLAIIMPLWNTFPSISISLYNKHFSALHISMDQYTECQENCPVMWRIMEAFLDLQCEREQCSVIEASQCVANYRLAIEKLSTDDCEWVASKHFPKYFKSTI